MADHSPRDDRKAQVIKISRPNPPHKFPPVQNHRWQSHKQSSIIDVGNHNAGNVEKIQNYILPHNMPCRKWWNSSLKSFKWHLNHHQPCYSIFPTCEPLSAMVRNGLTTTPPRVPSSPFCTEHSSYMESQKISSTACGPQTSSDWKTTTIRPYIR